MKIPEQIESIKNEIEKLDLTSDEFALRKYGFQHSQLLGVLKPLLDINPTFERLKSINWVISEYAKPATGKFSSNNSQEVQFGILTKEALGLLETLKDQIKAINDLEGKPPLKW